jgi:hypothetical protein
MFKTSFMTILLTIMMILIVIKLYYDSDYFNLKCVISDVNGKKYCVRDRDKLGKAADKLAIATVNMTKLVDHCYHTYPDNPNIIRLKKGFNPKKIQETLPTSEFTAYSENKGEKLAFCLNKNKNGTGGLIDDNTLMFVAIHELSHIATEKIGHTPQFWDNFKFLLKEAEKINIYKPVDYKKKPQSYCGMTIKDNPYYSH